MAEILKGSLVAASLNEKMQADVAALNDKGITPTMAILRVGERPDDLSYEKGAVKRCETVGVAVKKVVLPQDVSQKDFMEALESLNNDDSVHGILVFRPLPKQLDEEAMRRALKPEKDIDGITDGSLAGVFTGSGKGFSPCTAQAAMEILDYFKIDCKGKKAVVVGRSLVVGKPAAMLLMAKNATVTICHTKTVDMPSVTRNADILIVAAGKAAAITGEYLSAGQTVIDVGINFTDEGKLCGDVVAADEDSIVAAYTPVPGGVGTVTTSVLVSHVVAAAKKLS